KNEIDGYFEVQNLAISSGTGDNDCCQPLKDNRHYGRSRFFKQFADALKEKPVAGHRVVHARSCYHALAEESERGNCDRERNPARALLTTRDSHHIRSRS